MSAFSIALLFAAAGLLVLLAMWFSWRARARRDAGVGIGAPPRELSGEVLERFPRAVYVSTTPEGSPFERVALPGLAYRGYAEVTVRRDGVTVQVTGEHPVHLPSARVIGVGAAGVRAGKAVEQGGLSLLRWLADGPSGDGPQRRILESSFRLADAAEQRRFAEAITTVAAATVSEPSMSVVSGTLNDTDHTTQEDA